MNLLAIPLRVPKYERPLGLANGYVRMVSNPPPGAAELHDALVEACQAIELNARHAFFATGMSQSGFEATWNCDDKPGYEQWSRLCDIADQGRPEAANDGTPALPTEAARVGAHFDTESLEHGDAP